MPHATRDEAKLIVVLCPIRCRPISAKAGVRMQSTRNCQVVTTIVEIPGQSNPSPGVSFPTHTFEGSYATSHGAVSWFRILFVCVCVCVYYAVFIFVILLTVPVDSYI